MQDFLSCDKGAPAGQRSGHVYLPCDLEECFVKQMISSEVIGFLIGRGKHDFGKFKAVAVFGTRDGGGVGGGDGGGGGGEVDVFAGIGGEIEDGTVG